MMIDKYQVNVSYLEKSIFKIRQIIAFYKIPFVAIVARIAFIVSVAVIGQIIITWIKLNLVS
jgi:hypothetical protein